MHNHGHVAKVASNTVVLDLALDVGPDFSTAPFVALLYFRETLIRFILIRFKKVPSVRLANIFST